MEQMMMMCGVRNGDKGLVRVLLESWEAAHKQSTITIDELNLLGQLH